MGWVVWGSNPAVTFFTPIQTDPGDHPVSYVMSTWPGCVVDLSPPSSAKVQHRWSYTSTPPLCLQWHVMGWTLPLKVYIWEVGPITVLNYHGPHWPPQWLKYQNIPHIHWMVVTSKHQAMMWNFRFCKYWILRSRLWDVLPCSAAQMFWMNQFPITAQFFQNAGTYLPKYTCHIPEHHNLQGSDAQCSCNNK